MINDHAFFLLVSQNIFLVFEYLPIHISYHIPKLKFVEKCSIQKSQIFASFKLKSNQVYFINYLSCFKYGNFLLSGLSFCDFMKFDKECLYLVYWTFDFCKWTCELFPLHKRHFSFSSHCVKRNPFHKFFSGLLFASFSIPLTLHHNNIIHRLQRSFLDNIYYYTLA